MEIGLKIKHLLNRLPNDLPTTALSWFIKVIHFLAFVASVILVCIFALVIFTWGDFPFEEQINYIREHTFGRWELLPFLFLPLVASFSNLIMFRYTYKLDITTAKPLPKQPTTFCETYVLHIGFSVLYAGFVMLVYVVSIYSVLVAASVFLAFLPLVTWLIWNVYEWIVEKISRKKSENDPENQTDENDSSSNSTFDLLDAKKLADIMIV